MAEFKRTTNTTGKFKMLCIQDGKFFDSETAEIVPVATILEEVYGSGQPFDLSTTQKTDNEITPENE